MEDGRYTRSEGSSPDPEELDGYRGRLRLFAARRLGDWTAAEDVAQETLRRTIEAIRDGRIEESGALAGFLFRTARHICLHRARSAAREQRALRRLGANGPASAAANPLNEVISAEEQSSLREALGRLDPVERQVLEMSYRDELSSEDIGRQLGLTAGAVRVRRHRAIRRLAGCLGVTKLADRES
jgi:RNA polymerase sigma-70 factor, ECF subfamily